MLSKNITVAKNGTLEFAGYNTVELAKKYSTPLYLMDEEMIRICEEEERGNGTLS